MIDRHLIGDVVLAALLAIPTAALVRPDAVSHLRTAVGPVKAANAAATLAPAGDRQIGFLR